jgi:hypothetical protein
MKSRKRRGREKEEKKRAASEAKNVVKCRQGKGRNDGDVDGDVRVAYIGHGDSGRKGEGGVHL